MLTPSVVGVPIPYTNTLNDCLRACDNTPGCVDVSYSPGTPGPCYLKGSIGSVRVNSNIWGGRQLTGCSSSTKLKLHRKRVVHVQPAKRPLNKRVGLPVGPDFTFLGDRTTTVTYISTAVETTSTAYVLRTFTLENPVLICIVLLLLPVLVPLPPQSIQLHPPRLSLPRPL